MNASETEQPPVWATVEGEEKDETSQPTTLSFTKPTQQGTASL